MSLGLGNASTRALHGVHRLNPGTESMRLPRRHTAQTHRYYKKTFSDKSRRMIRPLRTLLLAIFSVVGTSICAHGATTPDGTNVATDTLTEAAATAAVSMPELADIQWYAPCAAPLPPVRPDSIVCDWDPHFSAHPGPVSPYEMPVSWTARSHDWKRLWYNTIALGSAFVGTLLVLECLPEDATSWNRAELQDVPLFKRWYNHVIDKGVEWDHDKFYFNYILHPYAGGVYFMAARSCGFNFWQSLLYCTIVSNVGWEYGIEAFMERPSIQDLFVTPIIGSCVGEGFYRIKRHIVDRNYTLWGSAVLGNIVAFLVDPVNEFVGFLDRNPARRVAREKAAARAAAPTLTLSPMLGTRCAGFALTARF